jgi:hypothetical protein
LFLNFKWVNALQSVRIYLTRLKVMNPYLDSSRGIYTLEPCRFQRKKRLEIPLLSAVLIRDKYLLHILMRQ